MALTQLIRATLVLVAGGFTLGGMNNSYAQGAGSAADGMLRVANNSQISGAEVENAVLGTWHGDWSNDRSGSSGSVTIEVEKAQGGEISGSGKVSGGDCPQDFSLSGWYRGSLVNLRLNFAAAGEKCPAGTVAISMRTGRNAGMLLGVGHWSDVVDGRAVSNAFGTIELRKQ
jgi:hypothetical protein